MIDIVNVRDLNLKNITQIGTPGEEEKIYIEDTAYARIHMDEFQEKRVFVLMGHTECAGGYYTTFIEAAIPVPEITFDHLTPKWTNRVWSSIFQEIRRAYENDIVVGWAMDLKGIAPKITPELESIHREHFGGVHQVFLLSNSLDSEEYFYLNKNNRLYRKDGFYIYYSSRKKRVPEPKPEQQKQREPVKSREIPISIVVPVEQEHVLNFDKARPQGRYREMMRGKTMEPVQKKSPSSAAAVVVAFVLLAAIIGTAVSHHPEQAGKVQRFIAAVSENVKGNTLDGMFWKKTSGSVPTETETEELGKKNTKLAETNAQYVPVEKVDGEIPQKNSEEK